MIEKQRSQLLMVSYKSHFSSLGLKPGYPLHISTYQDKYARTLKKATHQSLLTPFSMT